ncbi:DUF2141 domain-containing protein [Spirosoma endbachense]|uniref:DUF2141 domain-containing protein n=1 Tax=Spirosoma endbachense TaxID=2666025 RepID=A0A6P1VUQ3_9BACT|nr:DUF2141 domain-containing protein [Spirosoma endbachense]QHV95690.1 DUF2141 domain-containing protein [Spirosoma endbachense]
MIALFWVLWLSVWGDGTRLSATKHTLSIQISGLQVAQGTLLVSVFASPAGFPTDQSYALCVQKIPLIDLLDQPPRVQFNLPEGHYAVAVLHDKNKNGRMDTNWVGMPKEGYCVSNNVKGHVGPPRFEQAQFWLSRDARQQLQLIY